MSQIHVIYDPRGGLVVGTLPKHVKFATLSLADNLDDKDIYAIAKRLAELLLEQLG